MPRTRTSAAPSAGAPSPAASPARYAPLLVALPALLIAALGTQHPVFLTPETDVTWRAVHLALLPAFPLLAVSVLAVLRGERGPAAWGARLLASAYAVLYGALDSIAGIGAPQQVIRTSERGDPPPPIGDLYEIGDRLGALGVYSLVASLLLTAAVVYLRSRNPLALVGGAVGTVASYVFLRHHVFPPRGVLALVAVGAALALLELARRPRRA